MQKLDLDDEIENRYDNNINNKNGLRKDDMNGKASYRDILERSTRFRSGKSSFPELIGNFANYNESKRKSTKFTTRKSHTQDDMFFEGFSDGNESIFYKTDTEYSEIPLQMKMPNMANDMSVTTDAANTTEDEYPLIEPPKTQRTRQYGSRLFPLHRSQHFEVMSQRRVYKCMWYL